MKKILFSAYSLDIGGIETALVNLINYLSDLEQYEITLVLEKKQGIFLNSLNKKIHIIEYIPNRNKNVIIRKIVNLYQRLKFIFLYKNKYNFSVSFATYSLPASFVARTVSRNNCLWVHNDYIDLYNHNMDKFKEFFTKLKYDKFKHIIFVSKRANENFLKIFSEIHGNSSVCNNIINEDKILKKAEEKIEMKKDANMITFLNVGRHEEHQKKLTRLIQAASRLKNEGYRFKILFIGDGPETKLYQELIKKEKLENIILFLGRKENPYPYFKISDAVIITSEYEGYPVVFVESFILNIPIITTDVSDSKVDVKGKYGIVTTKEIESIYTAMKEFIKNGYQIKETFDAEKYNNEIIQKLNKLINSEGK